MAQQMGVASVGGRCVECWNDGGCWVCLDFEHIGIGLVARSLGQHRDRCEWDFGNGCSCGRVWRRITGCPPARTTTGASTLACTATTRASVRSRHATAAAWYRCANFVQNMMLMFGVQSPIGALARLTRRPWFAPKGLVEREVVADRILRVRVRGTFACGFVVRIFNIDKTLRANPSIHPSRNGRFESHLLKSWLFSSKWKRYVCVYVCGSMWTIQIEVN